MCETVGYVPRSAAGKDIRCANRECMVPVFTAPRPEKKVEEEKASPKKLTAKNLMMGLTMVGALSFAAWMTITTWSNGPRTNPQPTEQARGVAVPVGNGKDADKGVNPAPVQNPLTVSEERGAILQRMAIAAEDKGHNRSRPLCERITAHTAADCGDLELAGRLLERLQKAENGLIFYRVPPLTSIAWRQLKSGDRTAAGKTLDDCLSAAADLPVEGVFSIDSAAWLAAALTAAGRGKEAQSLVQRFPSSGPAGRLAAAETRAIAWNSCDIDREDQNRPLLDAPSLQLPVVVEITVASGFPKEALQLAQSVSDPKLQVECEVAWLEAVQRAKSASGGKPPAAPDPSAPDAEAVLAKLKPATLARCHARFALLRLQDNDRAGAETELKAALTALGAAKAGHEFELPLAEGIYRWQPSDTGPARQDALAFAAIAHVQAQLGQAEAANRNLAAALDCLRASAPSPSAVDAKEKVNRKDRAGLQSQLRTALKLPETRLDQAVRQYGANLKSLGVAAAARFEMETEILDAALPWAEPEEMWKLIGKRITAGDPDRREPYLTTPLPWLLIVRLKYRGGQTDADKAAPIENAVGGTPTNPQARLVAAIAQSKEASPSEIVRFIKTIKEIERADLERYELILADRLVKSDQFPKAFEVARKIEDPILKEEAMQWSVALACRLGHGRDVKKILLAANSSFLPTELVAAWRGFLIGLLAHERAEPASATAAPPVTAARPAATQPPTVADPKRAEAPKS
jgi:hypothetical protein